MNIPLTINLNFYINGSFKCTFSAYFCMTENNLFGLAGIELL